MAKLWDELSEQLMSALPEGLGDLKKDAQKNMKAALESALSKMNLVTREEFDAQKAVLERTQKNLAALEEKFKAFDSNAQ